MSRPITLNEVLNPNLPYRVGGPSNRLDRDSLPADLVEAGGGVPFTATQQGVLGVALNDLATVENVQQSAVVFGSWKQAVFSQTLTAPPVSPSSGDTYIVPAGATGDWAGHDGEYTVWRVTGWDFLVPEDGWTTFVRDTQTFVLYRSSAWGAVEAVLSHGSLDDLQGGTTGEHFHLTASQHAEVTTLRTDRYVLAGPTSGTAAPAFRGLEPADVSGSTVDTQVVVRRAGVPIWDQLTAADVGALTSGRQILTTNGLSGGGDLSADRTLSWLGLTAEKDATVVGQRRTLNFIGSPVSVVDNAVDERLDVTIVAVQPTRQINTGAGLSGGGDLSADLTFTWDGLTVAQGGTAQGTQRTLNFIGATVTEDAGNGRMDVTIAAGSNVVVQDNGTLVGSRSTINFLNATTIADNAVDDRIDVTLPTPSGGGAVDSVNTQTGVVVLDADDIDDSGTTNKFATQAQLDKVDHLTVSQAVDLDQLETDVGQNTTDIAGKADSVHSHTIGQVTNLQTELDGKASDTHTHVISDTAGLQTELDGKTDTGHSHSLSDISDNGSAAALNVPASGDAAVGEVVIGSDSRLSDARTPVAHTHTIANVTNLQTELDGKADDAHTHTIANVTNLQTELDGKAADVHTHGISDITGLQTALDDKLDTSAYRSGFLSSITGVDLTLTASSEQTQQVDASVPDINVILPDAQTLTNGHAVFVVINRGTNNFYVRRFLKDRWQIQPGQIATFTLTDNTSANGTWVVGITTETAIEVTASTWNTMSTLDVGNDLMPGGDIRPSSMVVCVPDLSANIGIVGYTFSGSFNADLRVAAVEYSGGVVNNGTTLELDAGSNFDSFTCAAGAGRALILAYDNTTVKIYSVSHSGLTVSNDGSVSIGGTAADLGGGGDYITGNQALMCWREVNPDNRLTLQVVENAGAAPVVGTQYFSASNDIRWGAVAALSPTVAVVAGYSEATGNTEVYRVDISGTTLTVQPVVTVVAGQASHLALCRASATTAVLVYRDHTNSGHTYAVAVDAAAATVLLGTPVVVASIATTYVANGARALSVAPVNADSVVVAYHDGDSTGEVQAVAIGVSGTTLTVRTPHAVNAGRSVESVFIALADTDALAFIAAHDETFAATDVMDVTAIEPTS